MTESNYRFLVSSIKTEIEVSEKLIEEFSEESLKRLEKRDAYGEGLNTGWVLCLKQRVERLKNQLNIVGEELEDDSQRTSAESLIG